MTTVVNQAVSKVASTSRTTRYGPKPVYSFQIGSDWYQTGFKNPGLSMGDVVSFDFTEDQYGKQVNMASLKKGAGTAVVSSLPAAAPSPAKPAASNYGAKGIFPIPALDGQRSIVRQNALTNARELFTMLATAAGPSVADKLCKPEEVVPMIIAIARKFEAYTAGDIEAQEIDAEMNAKKAA